VPTTDWRALGHPEIELEHKALARIVRELQSLVTHGPLSGVSALVEQLVAYSTHHFRSEEAAMRAARFPDLEAHTREHKQFTARVTLGRLQPRRTDRAAALFSFVERWFRMHTMGADERFAEFLRKRAV